MKHRRLCNQSGQKEALSTLEWIFTLGWLGLGISLLIFSCLAVR
ncbi:hypothetical protein [Rhabdochlamydiaceae symbiont of Dictyostelium giganteum]